MLRNVDSFQQVSPGTEAIQTAQNVHEGGLAAATGAHDGDELTSMYLNAYAAEGMNPRFAQVVILVSFFDADHRICGRVGSSCAEFIHSRSRFHWRFSHRR